MPHTGFNPIMSQGYGRAPSASMAPTFAEQFAYIQDLALGIPMQYPAQHPVGAGLGRGMTSDSFLYGQRSPLSHSSTGDSRSVEQKACDALGCFPQQSAIPSNSETHGGSPVSLHAQSSVAAQVAHPGPAPTPVGPYSLDPPSRLYDSPSRSSLDVSGTHSPAQAIPARRYGYGGYNLAPGAQPPPSLISPPPPQRTPAVNGLMSAGKSSSATCAVSSNEQQFADPAIVSKSASHVLNLHGNKPEESLRSAGQKAWFAANVATSSKAGEISSVSPVAIKPESAVAGLYTPKVTYTTPLRLGNACGSDPVAGVSAAGYSWSVDGSSRPSGGDVLSKAGVGLSERKINSAPTVEFENIVDSALQWAGCGGTVMDSTPGSFYDDESLMGASLISDDEDDGSYGIFMSAPCEDEERSISVSRQTSGPWAIDLQTCPKSANIVSVDVVSDPPCIYTSPLALQGIRVSQQGSQSGLTSASKRTAETSNETSWLRLVVASDSRPPHLQASVSACGVSKERNASDGVSTSKSALVFANEAFSCQNAVGATMGRGSSGFSVSPSSESQHVSSMATCRSANGLGFSEEAEKLIPRVASFPFASKVCSAPDVDDFEQSVPVEQSDDVGVAGNAHAISSSLLRRLPHGSGDSIYVDTSRKPPTEVSLDRDSSTDVDILPFSSPISVSLGRPSAMYLNAQSMSFFNSSAEYRGGSPGSRSSSLQGDKQEANLPQSDMPTRCEVVVTSVASTTIAVVTVTTGPSRSLDVTSCPSAPIVLVTSNENSASNTVASASSEQKETSRNHAVPMGVKGDPRVRDISLTCSDRGGKSNPPGPRETVATQRVSIAGSSISAKSEDGSSLSQVSSIKSAKKVKVGDSLTNPLDRSSVSELPKSSVSRRVAAREKSKANAKLITEQAFMVDLSELIGLNKKLVSDVVVPPAMDAGAKKKATVPSPSVALPTSAGAAFTTSALRAEEPTSNGGVSWLATRKARDVVATPITSPMLMKESEQLLLASRSCKLAKPSVTSATNTKQISTPLTSKATPHVSAAAAAKTRPSKSYPIVTSAKPSAVAGDSAVVTLTASLDRKAVAMACSPVTIPAVTGPKVCAPKDPRLMKSNLSRLRLEEEKEKLLPDVVTPALIGGVSSETGLVEGIARCLSTSPVPLDGLSRTEHGKRQRRTHARVDRDCGERRNGDVASAASAPTHTPVPSPSAPGGAVGVLPTGSTVRPDSLPVKKQSPADSVERSSSLASSKRGSVVEQCYTKFEPVLEKKKVMIGNVEKVLIIKAPVDNSATAAMARSPLRGPAWSAKLLGMLTGQATEKKWTQSFNTKRLKSSRKSIEKMQDPSADPFAFPENGDAFGEAASASSAEISVDAAETKILAGGEGTANQNPALLTRSQRTSHTHESHDKRTKIGKAASAATLLVTTPAGAEQAVASAVVDCAATVVTNNKRRLAKDASVFDNKAFHEMGVTQALVSELPFSRKKKRKEAKKAKKSARKRLEERKRGQAPCAETDDVSDTIGEAVPTVAAEPSDAVIPVKSELLHGRSSAGGSMTDKNDDGRREGRACAVEEATSESKCVQDSLESKFAFQLRDRARYGIDTEAAPMKGRIAESSSPGSQKVFSVPMKYPDVVNIPSRECLSDKLQIKSEPSPSAEKPKSSLVTSTSSGSGTGDRWIFDKFKRRLSASTWQSPALNAPSEDVLTKALSPIMSAPEQRITSPVSQKATTYENVASAYTVACVGQKSVADPVLSTVQPTLARASNDRAGAGNLEQQGTVLSSFRPEVTPSKGEDVIPVTSNAPLPTPVSVVKSTSVNAPAKKLEATSVLGPLLPVLATSANPDSIQQQAALIKPVHATSPTDKQFKCRQCHAKFARETDLTSHALSHRLKTYDCYKCIEKFTTMRALTKHLLIHQDDHPVVDRLFPCSRCNDKFESHGQLEAHFKIHEGKDLLDHQILKVPVAEFQSGAKLQTRACSHCGSGFETLTELRYHLMREHAMSARDAAAACRRGRKLPGDASGSVRRSVALVSKLVKGGALTSGNDDSKGGALAKAALHAAVAKKPVLVKAKAAVHRSKEVKHKGLVKSIERMSTRSRSNRAHVDTDKPIADVPASMSTSVEGQQCNLEAVDVKKEDDERAVKDEFTETVPDQSILFARASTPSAAARTLDLPRSDTSSASSPNSARSVPIKSLKVDAKRSAKRALVDSVESVFKPRSVEDAPVLEQTAIALGSVADPAEPIGDLSVLEALYDRMDSRSALEKLFDRIQGSVLGAGSADLPAAESEKVRYSSSPDPASSPAQRKGTKKKLIPGSERRMLVKFATKKAKGLLKVARASVTGEEPKGPGSSTNDAAAESAGNDFEAASHRSSLFREGDTLVASEGSKKSRAKAVRAALTKKRLHLAAQPSAAGSADGDSVTRHGKVKVRVKVAGLVSEQSPPPLSTPPLGSFEYIVPIKEMLSKDGRDGTYLVKKRDREPTAESPKASKRRRKKELALDPQTAKEPPQEDARLAEPAISPKIAAMDKVAVSELVTVSSYSANAEDFTVLPAGLEWFEDYEVASAGESECVFVTEEDLLSCLQSLQNADVCVSQETGPSREGLLVYERYCDLRTGLAGQWYHAGNACRCIALDATELSLSTPEAGVEEEVLLCLQRLVSRVCEQETPCRGSEASAVLECMLASVSECFPEAPSYPAPVSERFPDASCQTASRCSGDAVSATALCVELHPAASIEKKRQSLQVESFRDAFRFSPKPEMLVLGSESHVIKNDSVRACSACRPSGKMALIEPRDPIIGSPSSLARDLGAFGVSADSETGCLVWRSSSSSSNSVNAVSRAFTALPSCSSLQTGSTSSSESPRKQHSSVSPLPSLPSWHSALETLLQDLVQQVVDNEARSRSSSRDKSSVSRRAKDAKHADQCVGNTATTLACDIYDTQSLVTCANTRSSSSSCPSPSTKSVQSGSPAAGSDRPLRNRYQTRSKTKGMSLPGVVAAGSDRRPSDSGDCPVKASTGDSPVQASTVVSLDERTLSKASKLRQPVVPTWPTESQVKIEVVDDAYSLDLNLSADSISHAWCTSFPFESLVCPVRTIAQDGIGSGSRTCTMSDPISVSAPLSLGDSLSWLFVSPSSAAVTTGRHTGRSFTDGTPRRVYSGEKTVHRSTLRPQNAIDATSLIRFSHVDCGVGDSKRALSSIQQCRLQSTSEGTSEPGVENSSCDRNAVDATMRPLGTVPLEEESVTDGIRVPLERNSVTESILVSSERNWVTDSVCVLSEQNSVNDNICMSSEQNVLTDSIRVSSQRNSVAENILLLSKLESATDSLSLSSERELTSDGIPCCSASDFAKGSVVLDYRRRDLVVRNRCGRCWKRFSSFSMLRKHIMEASCKFVCRLCWSEFPSELTLRLHKKTTHFARSKLRCYVCKRGFERRKDLDFHERLHGDSFTCSSCGRVFPRTLDLQRHIAFTHASNVLDRGFCCCVCGRTFLRQYYLAAHMRKHGNVPRRGLKRSVSCLTPLDCQKHAKKRTPNPSSSVLTHK